MGLLPWTATVTADRMEFDGTDLRFLSARRRRQIIGADMSMIFQEPMTSLNPCFTVGFQLTEAMAFHMGLSRHERRERAIELLDLVGIPEPQRRLKAFPHQLSGGMNQRVMIAMSIACNPKLLIADEPTTALDVTIQAQILDIMRSLQKETGTAIVLITHDLGVVAEMCDRVAVMYAGEIVEQSDVATLFADPKHPYTRGLIASVPRLGQDRAELAVIPGSVPNLIDLPSGCRFSPRCLTRIEENVPFTDELHPELRPITEGHDVRCWLYHEPDGSLR